MLKDPDAKLPFAIDWSTWLTNEGDTAATATWIVPNGITQEVNPPATLAGGKATIWLSGGTDGYDYDIVCRLTTAGGRIDERAIRVQVRERVGTP